MRVSPIIGRAGGLVDQIPDAIDVANVSNSTDDYQGYVETAPFLVAGISENIILRLATSVTYNSFVSPYVKVYQADTIGGSYTETNSVTPGTNLDFTVISGKYYKVRYGGQTAQGNLYSQLNCTLSNLTAGGTIDTFTMLMSIDADDNYNWDDTLIGMLFFASSLNITTSSNTGSSSRTSDTVNGADRPANLSFILRRNSGAGNVTIYVERWDGSSWVTQTSGTETGGGFAVYLSYYSVPMGTGLGFRAEGSTFADGVARTANMSLEIWNDRVGLIDTLTFQVKLNQ